MNLTLPQMQKLAEKILEKVKREIARHNNFDPRFWIVKDGGLEELAFRGDWLNSDRDKEALFAAVKEMARRVQADGVIFLSDGWTLEFTEEQNKRLHEDAAYKAEFDRISKEQGCPQAAEAGYGELWEIVLVTIQSPLLKLLATQLYQRKPDGTFARFGPERSFDTTAGSFEGRASFFDEPGGSQ